MTEDCFEIHSLSWGIENRLEIKRIEECLPLFIGRKDFSQYTVPSRLVPSPKNPRPSPFRRIFSFEMELNQPSEKKGDNELDERAKETQAKIEREDSVQEIEFRVKGEGFLHCQVRMMVSALVRVGLGEISKGEIETSLEGKKTFEAKKAPGKGLFLNEVGFQEDLQGKSEEIFREFQMQMVENQKK